MEAAITSIRPSLPRSYYDPVKRACYSAPFSPENSIKCIYKESAKILSEIDVTVPIRHQMILATSQVVMREKMTET